MTALLTLFSDGFKRRDLVAPSVFASPLALTRSQTGTGSFGTDYLGDIGTTANYGANTPRFVQTALLVEGQRQNLLVNSGSGVAGQSVTVAAAAYTLSFFSAASTTIDLSGAYTGSLSGSGFRTLTFTASAGTLTIAVTGSPAFAQIEAGNFSSSWVSTAAAAGTRGTDLISAALSALNLGAGGDCSLLWAGYPVNLGAIGTQVLFTIDDGSASNRYIAECLSTQQTIRAYGTVAGANGTIISATSVPVDYTRVGLSISAGRYAFCVNGGAVSAQSGGPTTGLTTLRIGSNSAGGLPYFGTVSHFRVITPPLPDGALAAAVNALPGAG